MTEIFSDTFVWVLTGIFVLLLTGLVAYGFGQAAGRKMPPMEETEK